MSTSRRTLIRVVGKPMASPYYSARGLAGPVFGMAGEEPPSLEVTTIEATDAEVLDYARDPTVVGIPGAFPTRLISPEHGVGAGAAAATSAWGIGEVGADRSAFDGTGVKVAVLDTGIDHQHSAFTGMRLQEQDFSGEGNGDGNGHGTHCAGTIFGRDVLGTRIGVARGVVDAMIGKVLGDDGRGDTDMLLHGMAWAIAGGAKVVSMSIGLDFTRYVEVLVENRGYSVRQATSIALREYAAYLRAFDAMLDLSRASNGTTGGTIVVAAAGNDSNHPHQPISASLPAAADGVISVGAVGVHPTGVVIASFSNTDCQLVAPGVDVLSAKAGGGTYAENGTSMACPHVAGVAALWWQSLAAKGLPANATSVTANVLAHADASRIQGFSRFLHGSGVARAP